MSKDAKLMPCASATGLNERDFSWVDHLLGVFAIGRRRKEPIILKKIASKFPEIEKMDGEYSAWILPVHVLPSKMDTEKRHVLKEAECVFDTGSKCDWVSKEFALKTGLILDAGITRHTMIPAGREQKAFDWIFPKDESITSMEGMKCREANVLLISWEADEPDYETERLQSVFEVHGFEVDKKTIPLNDLDPQIAQHLVNDFLDSKGNVDCLSIICYAGHGRVNTGGGRHQINEPEHCDMSFTNTLIKTLNASAKEFNTLLMVDRDEMSDGYGGFGEHCALSTSPSVGGQEKNTCSWPEGYGEEYKCYHEWDTVPDTEALEHPSKDAREGSPRYRMRFIHCFSSDNDRFLDTSAGYNLLQGLRYGKPAKLLYRHDPTRKDGLSGSQVALHQQLLYQCPVSNCMMGSSKMDWRRYGASPPSWPARRLLTFSTSLGSLASAAIINQYGTGESKLPRLISLIETGTLTDYTGYMPQILQVVQKPSADIFISSCAVWALSSMSFRHLHQEDRFQDHAIVAGAVVGLGGDLMWSMKEGVWGSFGVHVFFCLSVAMFVSALSHSIARSHGNRA